MFPPRRRSSHGKKLRFVTETYVKCLHTKNTFV